MRNSWSGNQFSSNWILIVCSIGTSNNATRKNKLIQHTETTYKIPFKMHFRYVHWNDNIFFVILMFCYLCCIEAWGRFGGEYLVNAFEMTCESYDCVCLCVCCCCSAARNLIVTYWYLFIGVGRHSNHSCIGRKCFGRIACVLVI